VGLCLVDRRSLSFNGELLRCRVLGRVSAIARANIPKLGTRFGCYRVTVGRKYWMAIRFDHFHDLLKFGIQNLFELAKIRASNHQFENQNNNLS
jgi:hypothetical protein